MNRRMILLLTWVALGFIWTGEALAGKFILKYRDKNGVVHDITSQADLDKVIPQTKINLGPLGEVSFPSDPKGYYILKKCLQDSETRRRVEGLKDKDGNDYDVTVTVNSCHDTTKIAEDDIGSWSSGHEIQLQDDDWDRAMSTLSHEVGHSVMKAKCGQNPTHDMNQVQKYGLDKAHYNNEITNEKVAWSEGYAEYWGDRERGGEEKGKVPCAGGKGLDNLYKESSTHKGDYWNNGGSKTAWKDIGAANDMWACEGINARILKDMAENIPGGAGKIEEFLCKNTLKEVIKAWAEKYPKDAESIAKIVDVNTNYTMDAGKLEELVPGSKDYIDKERASNATKYKGKDGCDSVKDIFKDTKPGGGKDGGDGKGTGGGTKPGTGLPHPTGDKGGETKPTPRMGTFR